MAGQIIQLGTDDLHRALEELDPVATLIDELVTGTAVGPDWGRRTVQVNPLLWCDAGRSAGEFADAVPAGPYDQGDCVGCLIPATGLRTVRVGALAALAAQRLLTPGIVTAALLGSGSVAQLQASIIARCVPDVGHVALWPASGSCPALRLVDQLGMAGIGLSVTERADDAVRGANLVIFAGPRTDILRGAHGRFARGAVIVNGLGSDPPAGLAGCADQLFVDYAGLLREERRDNPGRPPLRVEADLVQVIIGTHPGRTDPDHILFVDLLSANSLSADLADQFRRAALLHGFGTRRPG